MGLKGRGVKRKFESIIIDEIDNNALDNLKNTRNIIEKKEKILKRLRDKSLQEFTKLQKENIIFIPRHLSYINDRLDD